MKRVLRLSVLPLVALILLAGMVPANALDKQTRLNVMAGVVQVSLVRVQKGQVYFLPWGSGTIISPDGLILTNCHVADPVRYGLPPEQVPDYDYLGIGLTVKSDRPPQLAYLAEVLQADPYLDLAVIRIIKKADLKDIDADELDLPAIEVGDSDLVEVGDDLNIFGYPGIGGDTVTFTRGVASGFTLDRAIDGRAWIKTDASISGGNSGGTAVDEQGFLVGVPTRAGVGDETDPVDCRPVKDTNGDGRIDGNDDCVPVGGFINALRPVNLAKPLIESALLGLPDVGRQGPTEDDPVAAGQPKFSNLFFSVGADQFNQPTQIVTSLPTGARSMYLFFDYENMDASRTVEMKLWIDGEERPDWGMPAGPWGGGLKGMWWIGWSDAEFADGVYDLALFVDSQELNRAQITFGGAQADGPTFGNLAFSLEATADGDAAEPATLFPAGTTEVLAFFDYAGMNDGDPWTRSWLQDGDDVASADDSWDEGESGRTWASLTNEDGFEPGAYRLNLYLGGELAALGNFWITEATVGSPTFGPVVFAEDIARDGSPTGAAESFDSGLAELHAFSEFSGMSEGIGFGVRWYIDGDLVIDEPYEWDLGESGDWHYYVYSSEGDLPDGAYDVELLVEDQLVQTGSTTIGTGVGPTPTPPPDEGVWVYGNITNVDTDRPIPGAGFLVLMPGITLETFQWTDDELYTSAEADRTGYFELPDPLQRGECYTMIIGADGYWPYGEDDVCFTEDDPDYIELSVALEKK